MICISFFYLYLACVQLLCGAQQQLQNYKYKLCIMTKIRSLSEHYSCSFLEWMEYHIIMGVDHIIVNDECSVDPVFPAALQFYKEQGYVTIANEQSAIVRNCANYTRNEVNVMRETYDLHHAKCEWVAVIDPDEYITLLDPTPTLLELLTPEHPFIRLPWFFVGSEGHEKRPQGMTMEIYKHGFLNKVIKTIAKTSEVYYWNNPHHPWVKHDGRHVTYNGKQMSLQHFVEEDFIRMDEHPRITGVNRTTNSTTNEIFLKHFVFLSWEEYHSQRAQYKVNSNGQDNVWNINGREKWKASANFKEVLAEEFTSAMAVKVRAALRARTERANTTVFHECASYWFV